MILAVAVFKLSLDGKWNISRQEGGFSIHRLEYFKVMNKQNLSFGEFQTKLEREEKQNL